MTPTIEAITARLLEVGDALALDVLLSPEAEEWLDLRRQLKEAQETV